MSKVRCYVTISLPMIFIGNFCSVFTEDNTYRHVFEDFRILSIKYFTVILRKFLDVDDISSVC